MPAFEHALEDGEAVRGQLRHPGDVADPVGLEPPRPKGVDQALEPVHLDHEAQILDAVFRLAPNRNGCSSQLLQGVGFVVLASRRNY